MEREGQREGERERWKLREQDGERNKEVRVKSHTSHCTLYYKNVQEG